MADFKVVAKRYGDSVEFFIKDATDAKAALQLARQEANNIFDYKGEGDSPVVSVRPLEEKE